MTTSRADRATRPVVSLPVLVGGLLLAYLPTYLPALARLVGLEVPLPGPSRVLVWNWLAVAALLLYVVRVERLDLASLRLVRPTEQDLSWAVTASCHVKLRVATTTRRCAPGVLDAEAA